MNRFSKPLLFCTNKNIVLLNFTNILESHMKWYDVTAYPTRRHQRSTRSIPFPLRSRPHFAREIWKQKCIKCFHFTLRWRAWKRSNHQSFWNCVLRNWLRQGNHMFILTQWFSESFVFKLFSVRTKTQSQRFQIPPFWRAYSKNSVFVMD